MDLINDPAGLLKITEDKVAGAGKQGVSAAAVWKDVGLDWRRYQFPSNAVKLPEPYTTTLMPDLIFQLLMLRRSDFRC